MIRIIDLFVRFLRLFYEVIINLWIVWPIWCIAPSIENENSIIVLASVFLLTSAGIQIL
jgi:hypothetical protein